MRYNSNTVDDVRDVTHKLRVAFLRNINVARVKPYVKTQRASRGYYLSYAFFTSIVSEMECDYEDILLRWLHTRYPETRPMWLED